MSVPVRRVRTARVVSGGRRQHRKLVWATSIVQNTAIAAGTRNATDLLSTIKAAGASVIGATIMRTHVKLAFSEASADTNVGPYLGLIVNSAPTATNPDPFSDVYDDWMLNTSLGPATADNVYFIGANELWGYTFDLRAKRKIEEMSEKYQLILSNQASGSVTFSMFTKTLLALP